MRKLLLALLLLAGAAQAQISNAPALLGQKGTSTPATCQVGQLFFDTNAAAGSNVFGCTSTNTWTLMGGGGGDVLVSGTPTAGQCASWTDATTIEGVDCPSLTGTPTAGDLSYWTSDTAQALLAGTGIIKLNDAAAPDLVTAPSGTIVGTSDTQTLTNKRITKRVSTTASSATPTPNADTTDVYTITALAEAAAFGAPTGTPTEGQALLIRVKDNGTARALTYNAIYRAGDTALPTTTTISKTLYIAFIYNATDTKWDFTGSADGF